MGSKKILIIDDNPDFIFTMETFLKRSGFTTLTAHDGKQGVEMAQKEHPDLILLDVMMETLYSGFEVCKRIRTDPQLKSIPIIGISGMDDELGVRCDDGNAVLWVRGLQKNQNRPSSQRDPCHRNFGNGG
jgi:CheY-like chemotaxis protein